MPVVFDIDKQCSAVIQTSTGKVTGEELVTADELFFRTRMREFRDCRTWLGDFTQADIVAVEMHHVRVVGQICIEASKQNPNLAVALATSPDLAFGLARAWEGIAAATGWKTMVFRSRAQAEQWLDAVQSTGNTV